MAKTYYNLPEVEALEAFAEGQIAALEESAQTLLAHGGIIADGTRGTAADSHEETAAISDQVSTKAREVITMVRGATSDAREKTIEQDAHGASMVGFGG